MNNALVEKLDVWGFENRFLIFKDKSLGKILEILPKDISCSTDQFLNSLHGGICDFLNGLPEGMNLQFVQMIDKSAEIILEKHEALNVDSSPNLAKRLLAERAGRIRSADLDGKIPNQKLYLVLRRKFVKKLKL